MSQLLIKNGSCVLPGAVAEADLLVDEGRIVAMGRNLAPRAAPAPPSGCNRER